MGEVFYTGPASGLAVSWYTGPARADGKPRVKIQLCVARGQILQLDFEEWQDLADCVLGLHGELMQQLPSGVGWPNQLPSDSPRASQGATDG